MFLLVVFTITSFHLVPSKVFSQNNGQPQFIKALNESEFTLSSEQQASYVRAKNNANYKSVSPVKMGSLPALLNRGSLPVKIPGVNRALIAKTKSVKAFSETEYTWYGEFKNEEGTMLINVEDDMLMGFIHVNEQIFEIHDLGNEKNIIIEVDNEIYTENECATQDFDDHNIRDEKRHSPENSRHNCNADIIRVLIVYTDAADDAISTYMPFFGASLVNQANLVLEDSDIDDFYFEIAGVIPWENFNEGNEIIDDRDFLSNDIDVEGDRDLMNADLVVGLTDGNYANGTIFGVAFLPEIPAGGDRDFAHCIVEADVSSGRFTFAHELAHLMRCRHDEDGGFPGAVATARGRNFFDILNVERRTVMALLPAGENRISHFSNPNVPFNLIPTGTADRNNVAQMNTIAPDIADYENDPLVPINPIISGTNTGNNNTIGSWSVSVNHCTTVTNIRWETSTNGFNYTTVLNGPTATNFSQQLPQDNDLYLRVTVNDNLSQSEVVFHHVYNEDNQNCGGLGEPPCARVGKNNDEEIDKKHLVKVVSNPIYDEISYVLKIDSPQFVNVELYDLTGHKMIGLTKGTMQPGTYHQRFQLNDILSGIHFLRFQVGDKLITKKVIILK